MIQNLFTLRGITLIACAAGLMIAVLQACQPEKSPIQYVNPFIGTDAHGHTYPGATVPFGMVQLSPQTRLDGWDGCSGYHYTDSVIYGFAHTALSGTGVSDYGDILLMPMTGGPAWQNKLYSSPFQKKNERASAGYYAVKLDKYDILAELTSTTRVGVHRYTFPESVDAGLLLDLQHRDRVLESSIEIISDTELRGMRRSTNWAKDMVWYFHLKSSKPFSQILIAVDDMAQAGLRSAEGTNLKAWLGFATTQGEAVEIKVALSAVDMDGATNNLKAEAETLGFDLALALAKDQWQSALNRFKVGGGKPDQLTAFYTAVYHAYLQPNTFMDADRRYRGMDHQVHEAEDFDNYTVFSLWDTYRAWHPLMTILEPERSAHFVRTMLNMYEKGGLLPIWELAANETYCMIGNHSIPVIVDAWMKDIRSFDGNKALEAMLHSSTRDHFGLDDYRRFGYLPGEKEHESVSKTLEYAYNDWCVAVMAAEMGREDIFREYSQRAQAWKHLFDPQTRFIRPRLNGAWLEPFNPAVVDWHFTEANSWQYSFYVPHDIDGLANAHGGYDSLAARLDALFSNNEGIGGRDMKDITGLIGQYAHGNEPSHHMAYLYNFVGQPWKTQEKVRYIMDNFYTARPDGLIGNEDCGQMSAWLIFSAMGFYPVAPGSNQYIIGTPWFPELELDLGSGKSFRVLAKGASPSKPYIKQAWLNGRPLMRSWLWHEEVAAGGVLEFAMDSRPHHNWATQSNDRPVTAITQTQVLPAPWFENTPSRFTVETTVNILGAPSGASVFYTLDGSLPDASSLTYNGPFNLDKSALITAVAWLDGVGFSAPAQRQFIKVSNMRQITLTYPPHPNYEGGGAEILIDGLKGAANWRLGGWQGYQDTDFEAVIDLGKRQYIRRMSASFAQDTRSWILMPSKVVFEVSDDGMNYRKVIDATHNIPDDEYGMVFTEMGGRANVSARYVKVRATNYGKLPEWHLGAGGQAYIFIDEIKIE
ncbi:MAG TPA: GH92 family glycosyl hydrolase [Bacteroidales bacterium]|nr:GH92 family glycosyl hydrolase [Bacteroidales bacterium]